VWAAPELERRACSHDNCLVCFSDQTLSTGGEERLILMSRGQ
jgi:hypothetical protein